MVRKVRVFFVGLTIHQMFVIAFDDFRAMLAADERSERAFALTTCCLEQNPANYTVCVALPAVVSTGHDDDDNDIA